MSDLIAILQQDFSGEDSEMNSVKRIAASILGIAAFSFVVGCGTSTKEVDTSTTYVPTAAPAQVVVQAPPVVMAPAPTTTSSTSSDRSRISTDSNAGGTLDSSSSHHSESTTVTPSN